MAKIAIVTDSNSGITQRQAAELGISVVPMPFDIDGKTYYEDISLTQEEFYIKLNGNADISTTQPSPENVMDMWRKLLEDHESVIYIPMSSGLSGSCQTAMVFSMEDEFDGKVFVIDNQRISVTQRQAVLDAKLMADEGIAVEEIVKYLMDTKMESSIYIMVDTLKYLKKGGRVTPAAAALGTILKLKPVLQIQGEKLDAFAKARTLTQAKNIMINAVKADVEKRFGGNVNNVHLEIAHTHNLQEALNFKEEVAAAFPELGIGFVGVALAFGLTVLTMAFAVGHISGGHFNPAVTLGLWAGGRFPAKEVIGYIVAQVVGGIIAAAVLYVIASGKAGFDAAASGFASNGFGEHSPGGYSMLSAIVIEIVLTAGFLLVIHGATDKHAPAGFAPIAIGLALTLIHLISIPVTNTSVNPARSTAVAIFQGGWALEQLWLFWVMPIIGGILGGVLYRTLLEKRD